MELCCHVSSCDCFLHRDNFIRWQLLIVLSTLCVIGSVEVCDVNDDLNTCYKMVLSYAAIGTIHKSLDNDKNGEVDPSETDKFLRKEFSLRERATKSRSLSEDDPLVSLDDLWTLWKKNPAFNWTVKQTAKWLIDYVELAQYEELFARHKIDGKSLPLLAMQNMSYLTDVLLIRNPIHKRKFMLKALDTILFGPPQQHGFLSVRDPIFTAATFGLIGALLVLAATVRAYLLPFINGKPFIVLPDSSICGNEIALRHLQHRLDHLEQLRCKLNNADHIISQVVEPDDSKSNENVNNMQSSFHKSAVWPALIRKPRATEEKTTSDKNMVADDNMQMANICNNLPKAGGDGVDGTFFDSTGYGNRGAQLLTDASWHCKFNHEAKWTAGSSNAIEPSISTSDSDSSLHCGTWENADRQIMVTNDELTLLLQMSHQMEVQYFRIRKFLAEKQLTKVRVQCKRLHRKRYNILGSVRLLHSDDFEDLEKQMLLAKQTLEHLQEERSDLIQRYLRIEALTGLQIHNNLDINQLRALLVQFKAPKGTATMSSKMIPAGGNCINSDGQHISTHHRHPGVIFTSPQWTSCDTETSTSGMNSPTSFPVELGYSLSELNMVGAKSKVRHHSSKSGLPRTYSFVRPFAALWRKKAGSHTFSSTSKKPQ